MREPLETGAVKVLQTLQQKGYEAYLVGGCVRDKMLQRPVKDYDIATSARPEQVQQAFNRTIPTGLQHGTVTVIMDGFTYEVTTFRKEEGYEQYRRPSEVHYIENLQEDLRRRDFTMNAMALDVDGKLVDPFEGLADLRQGLLRCVGEPNERFEEDALRMLRCIRFASEYDLVIEARTWDSLCEHIPLLKHIAMERVRMELERMIAGAAPQRAVRLLAESRLLHHIKEPLRLARLDTIKEMKALGELASPSARWAYIYLSLVISPSDVEEELKRLTFSKQQIKTIGSVHEAASLIGDRLRLEASEDASGLERIWKLAALQFGTKALSELLDIVKRDPLKEAQFAGISSGLLDVLAMDGAAWLEELTVTNLSQLSVSGKELLSHVDRKAGPWMTALLQHLLEETALGHVENETDKLIDEAKRWVCKKLS